MVAGLGFLTKYERDKHSDAPFSPPSVSIAAPDLQPPVADEAYQRISAMTSCEDLRALVADAATRIERLREEGRVPAAQAAEQQARWADGRITAIGCG